MAKDKSHQMDFRGLEILADEFTGTVNQALEGVTVVATADATDLATAVTLVNALKVKVNQIINAMN